MILSEKTINAILQLQKLYPEKRSALIPALHLAQADAGYLPVEIQNQVALLFEIDVNEVSAVVSFYDMFFDKPVGKHIIHVCKNLSCMLRGADGVLKGMCQKLKINPEEVNPEKTTLDGQFTLIASECLASCDLAPMMLVDEKIVGPVQLEDLDHIIEEAKKGKGHPSPIDSEAIHA
jgi:NADH-quinone oxidoreductase subunit E